MLQKVRARVGTDEERNLDATAAARLAEAAARVSERLSKMFGLDVPVRIQEESLRVNLTKIDERVVVHFDRDQLKPKWPTPYGPREPICNGMRERIADVSTDDSPAMEES